MSHQSQERQLKRETPPFCCNCRHYFIPEEIGVDKVPRCRIAQMLDLVSGTKFYPPCQDIRHPEAPCGTMAKMFEPANIEKLN